MTSNSDRDQVAALLARTRDEVLKCVPNDYFAIASVDGFVVSLSWRSFRLFDGIVALIDKNLPEEALILSRALFTDALRLAELQAAGDERAAYILHWLNKSIDERISLVREAVRLGLEADPTELTAKIEAQRAELQDYRVRKGVGRLRPFLTERDAAQKFGRAHEYWGFCFSHEFVHGNDVSLLYSRRKVDAERVMIHAQTTDPKVVEGVATFAMASVLQGAIATVRIFKWGATRELEELAKEVHALSHSSSDDADQAPLVTDRANGATDYRRNGAGEKG